MEKIGQSQAEHYYPGAKISNAAQWDSVLPVLRQVLDGNAVNLVDRWGELAENLESEHIIRYFGHELMTRGEVLPAEAVETVKKDLLMAEAEKLSDDHELALIFKNAEKQGLPIMLFKGEALARTVYPMASCRPTGDYDMLIRPQDLPAFQSMFSKLGYSSSRFAGTHLFGEQAWQCPRGIRGRSYLVDLHWDITNRRFFRNRMHFDELLASSCEIPLLDGTGRIPGLSHNLLIACVHLAAAPVSEPVYLRWLVDIRLLLDALSGEEFGQMVQEAQAWGLVDVLAVYCELTARHLGPCRHQDEIEGLLAKVSGSTRQRYAKACDNRIYDLLEYARRLKTLRERFDFTREAIAYLRQWKSHRKT